MTEAVSIALSSVAIANSQLAIQMAKKAECEAFIANFNPKKATLEEKREYAECVQLVYGTGKEMAPGDVFALKALILIALACSVAGFYLNKDEPVLAVLFAIAFGGMAFFGGALLCVAISFLFK